MNVAVLVSGGPPPRLRSSFGGYTEMIVEMLGQGFAAREFDVRKGEYPDPEMWDAFVISGSPASVKDPEPWLPEVKAWIRRNVGLRPMLGLCFGHQLMAEALGGRVAPAKVGWGLGLDTYRMAPLAGELGVCLSEVTMPVTHGEQVIVPPQGARVIGGSALCPNGILVYPEHNALSTQAHPDYHPLFAEALIEIEADAIHSPDQAQRALNALKTPNDNAEVGHWLACFLAKGLPQHAA